MLSQIISMLTLSFTSCVSWFNAIFTRSGVSSLWLVSIFMVFVSSKLLLPFLGSGSDRARRRRDDE